MCLNDFVKRYKNTVHRTIKMKPINAISGSYGQCNKDSDEKKILNLKLVIV